MGKMDIFPPSCSKDWVKNFNGPTKIQRAAGTGKTVVALHRAIFLLRKYKIQEY